MEFLGEELEPGIAGEVDEAHAFGGRADFEAVAEFEPAMRLAIDGEKEFLALVADAESDEAVVGQDDGAVAERVGADGFKDQRGGFTM